MLGFFPVPYKDELLYSVLARMRASMPGTPTLPWLRAAFGDGVRTIRPCLPGQLARLCARIPGEVYSVRDLVERHTTWPYHVRFWERSRAELLFSCLEQGWFKGGRGVRAETFRHPASSRACLCYCEACVTQDVRHGGLPGWRRVHQLPGVFVCPHHAMPLRTSNVAARNQLELLPCPAERGSGTEMVAPLDGRSSMRVAQGSLWLLENPGGPLESRPLQAAFRCMLDERGWLLPNGMAKGGLRQAVEDRHGTGAMLELGMSQGGSPVRNDPQRLWGRTSTMSCSLLWCLIVLDFLDTTVAELMDKAGSQPEKGCRVRVPHVNPRMKYIRMHRGVLERTVRSAPTAGRKAIKQVARTSYLYLQRNDPEWLEAHLPAKMRPRGAAVDWKGRDDGLAAGIAELAKAWVVEFPETRLTRTRLAEAMGLRTELTRHDPRLPKSSAALAAFAESREAFRLRRLRHACAQGPATWSEFIRRAAFRPSEFPALTDHARRLHASIGCAPIGLEAP